MLISQKHQIGFIHIPKCGGSTIRHQFKDMGDTEPHFSGRHHHPDLGRIFLGHLPLWAVRDYYPHAFGMLQDYALFAICRDPYARFESAVSQYLHFHHGKRINDFPYDKVLQFTQEIITYLSATPRPISADYCHFIPQSHYIELDGQRMVYNLYPMTQIPQLTERLSGITGIAAATGLQSNETLAFKIKGSETALRRISGLTRRLMPIRLYAPIKAAAKRALVRKGSQHKGFALREAGVRDFVASYYARDIVIYAEVMENTP